MHVNTNPSLLVGDFNSVKNPNDRVNYQYAARDIHNFNSFVDNLGLEKVD